MKRQPRIHLTEQVIHSLEALLAAQESTDFIFTPRERGVRYVTALVRRHRGQPTTRARFDTATADSLGDLILKCEPPAPTMALGLQYLRQQVEHYRSPARVEARQREVARVRRHQILHKEADGA